MDKTIYELESNYIGLWPIFISKIIGYWILMIILFTFVPFLWFLNPILKSIIFLAYPIYMVVKDNPFKWKNIVKIDYISKTIKLNESSYQFDDIKMINANQYESFIFPTYYKIFLQLKDKNIKNLVAFKSPQRYSELLSDLRGNGLTVN